MNMVNWMGTPALYNNSGFSVFLCKSCSHLTSAGIRNTNKENALYIDERLRAASFFI